MKTLLVMLIHIPCIFQRLFFKILLVTKSINFQVSTTSQRSEGPIVIQGNIKTCITLGFSF